MARIVGIDLGSHTVKLHVLEGTLGRTEFAGTLSAPVPQGLDAPPDLAARVEVLRALWEEVRPVGKRERVDCAVAWPSDLATVRRVRLPFRERDKVDKVLPFEVENLVPFPLEEMVLASRHLGADAHGSTVLVALAPKARVAELLHLLAEQNPRALVVDADLLGDLADAGVTAVVDVGHSRTVVALCVDGRVVGARTAPVGGRDLTLALVRELGLDWSEAEEAKHAARIAGAPEPVEVEEVGWDEEPTRPVAEPPPAPPDPRVGEVLRRAVQPLLTEVRASLIALEDAAGVGVEEIRTCGGGSRLGGLRELLAERLGVPVRTAWVPDADERFALARAAALRASRGGRGRALDLRRDEFAFRGDLAVLGALARTAAVAALVFVVAGIGIFVVKHHRLATELDQLDARVRDTVVQRFPDVPPERLREPSTALAIVQERVVETTSRVDALGQVLSPEPPVLSLLRDLSEAMPPPSKARVDVSELSVGPTGITIKAETDGYEAAARIEQALQASTRFKGARKGDEKKSRNGVRFTITIPRGDAGTEEG